MDISGNMPPLFFPMAMFLVVSVAGLWAKMVLNPTASAETTTLQTTATLEVSEPLTAIVHTSEDLMVVGHNSKSMGKIINIPSGRPALYDMLCAYCLKKKTLSECEFLCFNSSNLI